MKKIIEKLEKIYQSNIFKKVTYYLKLILIVPFIMLLGFILTMLIMDIFDNLNIPASIIYIIVLVVLSILDILLVIKFKRLISIEAKVIVIIALIISYYVLSLLGQSKFPLNILWTYSILTYNLIPLGLVIVISNVKWKSIATIALTMTLAVSLAIFSGGLIYNSYLQSIAIVNDENIDTSKYLAFDENSEIARLPYEYKDKFQYNDYLPIVDGAAAFFPMYSSFVETLYPKNIGKLNQTDSPYKYHNTIEGYYGLLRDRIDIMFGVYPSVYQLEAFKNNNLELELIPYAADAFVFFVNKKNPVDSLTIEEVKKIYNGEITNWKEVGGNDEKIKAFQRNRNSGSQTAMEKFMGDVPLMEAPLDYYYSTMVGIVKDVSDYKNFKGAIGYSFLYYAQSIVQGYEVKMLKIEGVAPNFENIQSGKYPIIENAYIGVIKRNESIDKIINFVLSKEGQYLVLNSGYIPLYDYLKEEDYETK